MQKKLEEDQQADEDLKAKFDCWCKTNKEGKEKAIAAGQEKLAELKAEIKELEPRIEQLGEEIKTTEKEVAASKQTLDTAFSIRKQQSKNFKEDESKLLESIDQVAGATKSLAGSMPDSLKGNYETGESLLQMKPHALQQMSSGLRQAVMSNGALLYTSLSRADKSTLDDFLNDPKSSVKAQSFLQAPSSSVIVGILQTMADDMAANLQKELDEEAENKKHYEELEASMQAQIKAGEELINEKSEDKANAETKLATAKKDQKVTQKTLDEDIAFQAQVEKRCGGNDAAYEARIASRNEEIEAVGKTIDVVTGDEARELLRKTVSFLQEKSEKISTQKAKKVGDLLIKTGQRIGQQSLVSLGLDAKLDGFKIVKAKIENMVSDLKKQQQDEVEQRDECIADLNQNSQKNAEKKRFKDKTETKIGDLKATLAECAKDIEELEAELKELNEDAAKATENRQKENDEFQMEAEEQKATQKVLQKAVKFLQNVYGGGVSSEKKSFLQMRSRVAEEEEAPPAVGAPEDFKEYKKSQAGVGIVSLIETIIEDSVKLEAKAVASEQEEQTAYEEFQVATGKSIKAKTSELDATLKRQASAKGDLAEEDSILDATETEIEHLFDVKLGLHKECDFFLANFDVRQKARSEEMDGLVQAKAILGGAK